VAQGKNTGQDKTAFPVHLFFIAHGIWITFLSSITSPRLPDLCCTAIGHASRNSHKRASSVPTTTGFLEISNEFKRKQKLWIQHANFLTAGAKQKSPLARAF
jgi:hypothetical protein